MSKRAIEIQLLKESLDVPELENYLGEAAINLNGIDNELNRDIKIRRRKNLGLKAKGKEKWKSQFSK